MLVRSSTVVKKHLENTALSNTRSVNNYSTTSTANTTDSTETSSSGSVRNGVEDKIESPEAAAERVKCKYTR